MLNSQACAEIQRLLERHGLPRRQLERIVGELSDHWEDLHANALEGGLPPEQAAAQADCRLGKPAVVARELISSLNRNSWFGRHPLIALCLLPIILAPLLMVFALLPGVLLNEKMHIFRDHLQGPVGAWFIVTTFKFIQYSCLALASSWLCWKVWTAGLGHKWLIAMCVWCVFTALLRSFNADPVARNISFSVSLPWQITIQSLLTIGLHAALAITFCFGPKLWDHFRQFNLSTSPKP